MSSAATEAEFEKAVKTIADLRQEHEKLINKTQDLGTKKRENQLVQAEFSRLKEDAEVYKLIGPTLVKQSVEEAKSTIDKRIEFIDKDMARTEEALKENQTKSNQARELAIKLQTKKQGQDAAAAAAAGTVAV